MTQTTMKFKAKQFGKASEAPLNPSVEPADEDRLERHFRKLYRLFVARHRLNLPVSTLDLMEYAKAQYNARLWELRWALVEIGWCIDKVRKGEDGVNYYRLVPLAESTYYAKRKHKKERR